MRALHWDGERRLLFGILNDEVVANANDLHFGEELAISYGRIR